MESSLEGNEAQGDYTVSCLLCGEPVNEDTAEIICGPFGTDVDVVCARCAQRLRESKRGTYTEYDFLS